MAGLSEAFTYVPKPAAAPAANIRVSVPPHNKDQFSQGNETMMFNIPAGKRGQYLNTRMSYLEFDVVTSFKASPDTGTPILALDGGAHSLFESLEVYHGSNLLEQIREYNCVYQTLMDVGEDSTSTSHGRTVSEGMNPPMLGTDPNLPTNPDTERSGKIISPARMPKNYGFVEYTQQDSAGAVVTTNTPAHYANAEGYVPVTYPMVIDGSSVEHMDTDLARNNFPENGDVQAGAYKGASLASGVEIRNTFCIPLVSGVVGVQQGKYIPVGALAADLRLELGLAPWEQGIKPVAAFTGASTIGTDLYSIVSNLSGKRVTDSHNIRIERVNLQLEYVEVAADVQLAIESATGGQYVMSYDSFQNFQNAIPANSSTVSQLIGARFSSIKTALAIFRDQYKINRMEHSGITSRVNPFSRKINRPELYREEIVPSEGRYQSGSGWWFAIGSTYYPPRPVESDPEAYMELVKSQHSVASQQSPGLINSKNWAISARRDSLNSTTIEAPGNWYQFTSPGGTFIAAQNFESQSHKSHLTESGVNTLAQSMYFNARFPSSKTFSDVNVKSASALASSPGLITTKGSADETSASVVFGPLIQVQQALQMDTFVHYDGIIIISNGIASTRF